MQSEGHYAVVLDDVVGFFYGPLFVNGFRVLVSDEPVEEEPLPAEPPQENDLLDAIRVVVSAFAAFGLLWVTLGFASGLLTLLRGFAQNVRSFSEFLPFLAFFLPIMAALTLFAICAPRMEILNRILRDESSVISWVFRGMVLLWVAMELLWFVYLILMIAWWFIHGSASSGLFRF
jgi:hypothetical protein